MFSTLASSMQAGHKTTDSIISIYISMEYKILPLTIADIPEIFSLSSIIFGKDFPQYSPKVAKIYSEGYFSKNYYEKLLKNDANCILGLMDEGKIIAIAVLKGEYGGVLFVDLLMVEEKYRSKGIGSKLLQESENWALKHNYHYLWLFTESEKNIEYYKHRGFTYVGVHKGAWFGADEHILSKQLKSEPFPEVFNNYQKYFG